MGKYELSPFKVIIELDDKIVVERVGIIDIPERLESPDTPLIQDVTKLVTEIFNESVNINKYLITYLGSDTHKIRFYYYRVTSSMKITSLNEKYEWMSISDFINSDNSSRITTDFISRNYMLKFLFMMDESQYIYHIVTKLMDGSLSIKIQSREIYRRCSDDKDQAKKVVSCMNNRDRIKCKSIIDSLLGFTNDNPNTTKYYNPLGYYIKSIELLNNKVDDTSTIENS